MELCVGDPREMKFFNILRFEEIKKQICAKWKKVYSNWNANVLFEDKIDNCENVMFYLKRNSMFHTLLCEKSFVNSFGCPVY